MTYTVHHMHIQTERNQVILWSSGKQEVPS